MGIETLKITFRYPSVITAGSSVITGSTSVKMDIVRLDLNQFLASCKPFHQLFKLSNWFSCPFAYLNASYLKPNLL